MKVVISKNISWQIYDNVVYILDERTDTMCKLENEGFFFWKFMLENGDDKYIAKMMASIYDISEEQALEDVKNFVVELREEGMLEEKNDRR